MQNFKDLQVWQSAHELALALYGATKAFPREEVYGLTGQIRRAGASIAANIAEGCGRAGKAEFAQFLQIAMGSASELEYHLLLARDLGFLTAAAYEPLEGALVRTKRMLNALIQTVRSSRLSKASGQLTSPRPT